MYKPPIEMVMEEVFQKMDEDFENSIFKAIQKVGINVDKEELLKALIYDRGQYDKGYEDAMNEVKHPQPLKFEELHENMWVYDVKNKCCIYIEEFTVDNQMMIIRYPMSNRDSNCEWCNFEENRFYPIIIPIIGDNNEKYI